MQKIDNNIDLQDNIDIQKIRKDFPILNKKIDNKKIIYFDNAATTLKPRSVIENINNYYLNYPVNIHRGNYKLSQIVSSIYKESKEKVAKFINSKPKEVIYTQNSTDSINTVMYSLLNSNYFKKRDEIIISISEHHANLVSWQYLAKKLDLNLKFINLNDDFTLDLEDLKSKLSSKTKLVALNHISNTLGIINNIKKINKIVKNNNKNTLFLVDASQSAPHIKIDFKDLNIDFLCFTAHKMLGPTGLGILVAKQELLEKLEPCRFGGDMIKDVNVKRSLWNDLPNKFEAGTPHIAGAFGLSSAIDYLEEIGLKNIHKYDQKLLDYALDLLEDSKIELYNFRDKNTKNRSPIILFGMDNMDCRTLSALLDESENIATRAGVHCAQPIINKINKQGVSRASFYLYNTTKEIDLFVNTLKKISKI